MWPGLKLWSSERRAKQVHENLGTGEPQKGMMACASLFPILPPSLNQLPVTRCLRGTVPCSCAARSATE
jgi:hypothetical protein